MLKKRLIFTLLIENGFFMLSRNFSLQTVGNLQWIRKNYDFDSISASIDELVVLNVGKSQNDLPSFSKHLIGLSKGCFVPIASGGGIRKMQDAELILHSGADKLVVNTSIIENPDLVRALVAKYGSQCIVASIDFRNIAGERKVFTRNGTNLVGVGILDFIKKAEQLKVGEIYLTSIAQDGTGMGYDADFFKEIIAQTKIPVILSGGAGREQHLIQGFKDCGAQAVSTANLFNFMAGGIKRAREHMLAQGIDLAVWN